MKKEEIHQEAVKRRPDLLNSLEWEEGALWMNEKQPYSAEDMKIAFAQGFAAAVDSLNAAYESVKNKLKEEKK